MVLIKVVLTIKLLIKQLAEDLEELDDCFFFKSHGHLGVEDT